MAYLGYIRVSDVAGRNGDSFISPAVQRETIQRLAAAKGLELGEIVEELDVSGGKKIGERKLGALVEKIKRGESEGLIVWKVSRFSRSQLDAVEVLDRIDKAGGRLIAEDFDSAAPMAKAMRGLMSGLAEEERDQRREGWAQAQKRAIARGVLTHKRPYGYQRSENGELQPHPGQAEIVRRIFKLKTEGKTLAAIERALDGTPSPTGGSKWSHSTLRQVVANRVYLGELSHGDHLNRQAHEPILDETTFQLAQAVKPRREIRGKIPRSAETITAGLARCAGCGHTLKVIPGYRGRLTLHCKPESYAYPCAARAYIRADELDPYVETWFLSAIRGHQIQAEAIGAAQGLSGAQERLERATEALRIYVSTVEMVVEPEIFQHGLGARQAEFEEARKELARVGAQASAVAGLPDGDLHTLWPSLTPLEKRELVSALVGAVYVERGREPASERVRIERV